MYRKKVLLLTILGLSLVFSKVISQHTKDDAQQNFIHQTTLSKQQQEYHDQINKKQLKQKHFSQVDASDTILKQASQPELRQLFQHTAKSQKKHQIDKNKESNKKTTNQQQNKDNTKILIDKKDLHAQHQTVESMNHVNSIKQIVQSDKDKAQQKIQYSHSFLPKNIVDSYQYQISKPKTIINTLKQSNLKYHQIKDQSKQTIKNPSIQQHLLPQLLPKKIIKQTKNNHGYSAKGVSLKTQQKYNRQDHIQYIINIDFEQPRIQSATILNSTIYNFEQPIQIRPSQTYYNIQQQNSLNGQFALLRKNKISSISKKVKLPQKNKIYNLQFSWQVYNQDYGVKSQVNIQSIKKSGKCSGELFVFWNHRLIAGYSSTNNKNNKKSTQKIKIKANSCLTCNKQNINLLKFIIAQGSCAIGIDNIKVYQ